MVDACTQPCALALGCWASTPQPTMLMRQDQCWSGQSETVAHLPVFKGEVALIGQHHLQEQESSQGFVGPAAPCTDSPLDTGMLPTPAGDQ